MPRDINGNFNLPAGNPVVSGEVVASAWANTTMSDIAQALSDSLDRFGRGGMLAPFKFADGMIGAPGAAWQNEPTSGFYRPSAGDIRISVLGSDKMRWIHPGGVQLWNETSAEWQNVLMSSSGQVAVEEGSASYQSLRWDNGQKLWMASSLLQIAPSAVGIGKPPANTILSVGGTSWFGLADNTVGVLLRSESGKGLVRGSDGTGGVFMPLQMDGSTIDIRSLSGNMVMSSTGGTIDIVANGAGNFARLRSALGPAIVFGDSALMQNDNTGNTAASVSCSSAGAVVLSAFGGSGANGATLNTSAGGLISIASKSGSSIGIDGFGQISLMPVTNSHVNIGIGGTGSFSVDGGGNQQLLCRTNSLASFVTVGNTTATPGNNVVIDGSGVFLRLTSTRASKRDITPYTNGLAAVMAMRPVFYRGANEYDAQRKHVSAGFIAEDFDQAGLNEFVTYDGDTPMGIDYGKVTAALAAAIQELAHDRH